VTTNFDPIVARVRKRINLGRNKRLRDALSEGSTDPSARLSRELPTAVIIEWTEMHPDGEPPASVDDVSNEEMRTLTNRVTKRLAKQADEGEKVVGAARRAPASTDEDEQDEKKQTLKLIAQNAGLTNRERDVYELTLCEVEDEEIAEILGLKRDSLTKTKYRMMQKLRASAAKVGYSEKLK
jgi:DNA-binding CsgD family transcriptional regulator